MRGQRNFISRLARVVTFFGFFAAFTAFDKGGDSYMRVGDAATHGLVAFVAVLLCLLVARLGDVVNGLEDVLHELEWHGERNGKICYRTKVVMEDEAESQRKAKALSESVKLQADRVSRLGRWFAAIEWPKPSSGLVILLAAVAISLLVIGFAARALMNMAATPNG